MDSLESDDLSLVEAAKKVEHYDITDKDVRSLSSTLL